MDATPTVQGSTAFPSSTPLPHKSSQALQETRTSTDVEGKEAFSFHSASKRFSPRKGAAQEADSVEDSDPRPKPPAIGQDAPPSREKRSDVQDALQPFASADVPANVEMPVAFPAVSTKEYSAAAIPKKPEHPPGGGLVVQKSTVDVEKDGDSLCSSSDKKPQKYFAEDDRESTKSKTSSFFAKAKEWGIMKKLLRTVSNLAKTADPSTKKPTEKIDLNPDDCVILVMGPTGAGKSTFISKAMGIDVGIGDSLSSCTTTINTFRLPPPIEGSPLDILGTAKVVLVDTPGFGDTSKPDHEIFEMVSKWLKTMSLDENGIAGLIYLHRIGDSRMVDTPSKNLNMFQELFAKKFMTNVTMMTTMWAGTVKEDAIRRERELGGKHFKELLRLGATLARFEDNQASVARILEPLVSSWGNRQAEDHTLSMVRSQKEIAAYDPDIAETSAADALGKVQAILERRQKLLDKLSNEDEANKDDPEFVTGIMSQMTYLRVELEEAQRDADRMRNIGTDTEEDRSPAEGQTLSQVLVKTRKIAPLPAKKKEQGLLNLLLKPTPSPAKPTEKLGLDPEDCVIIIMGPQGSGKSTFISTAMGVDIGIGNSLSSCTSAVNTFRLPPAVEGSPMACLGDTKVFLVDTPGFDDTNKPDYEIFEMIAQWLKNVSLNSLGIAGIIYLHRISDRRIAGTPLKNLEMFRELCGKKFMTNVTLMTTMWAEIPEEDAVRRERVLAGKYFKELLQLGAKLARFEVDQDSTARILEPLVNTWRNTQDEDRVLSMVRLQKELTTYNLDIAATSAARVIHGKVQTILERRRELLGKLASEIEAKKDDPEFVAEIMSQMTRLQVELEEAQREDDRLHLDYASYLKLLAAKMRRVPRPVVALAKGRLASHTNATTSSSPVG